MDSSRSCTSDGSALKKSNPDYHIHFPISGILGSLDEKIEVNRKKIAELEALAKTIYDQLLSTRQCTFTSVGEELSVITGKRDSNFATKDGAYRFFTCSKERLVCNEYDFEGRAILLSGNGDLHVKFFNGKFNAYQRTYVLMPRNLNLFGTLIFATRETLARLTSGAAGSIVKFITKSDVERIRVPLFKIEEQILLSNLMLDILNEEKKIDELIKHRDMLLPLLMNGQVSIKD